MMQSFVGMLDLFVFDSGAAHAQCFEGYPTCPFPSLRRYSRVYNASLPAAQRWSWQREATTGTPADAIMSGWQTTTPDTTTCTDSRNAIVDPQKIGVIDGIALQTNAKSRRSEMRAIMRN